MTQLGDDRAYVMHQQVRLGDTTRRGRLRLDALARYLQDVATEDTAEVDMPDDRGWVLRRMEYEIGRLPSIYELVDIETRCTGVGRRWAERTTTLAGVEGLNSDRSGLAHGVVATARAVWVYISLDSGAPQSLRPEFFAAYGDAIRAHKVSARLTHPDPPEDAPRVAWPSRSSDIDVFGHVNNAIYWIPVEDFIAEHGTEQDSEQGPEPWVEHASIEFGAGIDPGDQCDLVRVTDPRSLWIWFLVGDDVRASVQVRFGSGLGGRAH